MSLIKPGVSETYAFDTMTWYAPQCDRSTQTSSTSHYKICVHSCFICSRRPWVASNLEVLRTIPLTLMTWHAHKWKKQGHFDNLPYTFKAFFFVADGAENQPVVVSGIGPGSSETYAVDNDDSTCTTVEETDRPWLVVDLGMETKVHSLVMLVSETAYAESTGAVAVEENQEVSGGRFWATASVTFGTPFCHPPCVEFEGNQPGFEVVVTGKSMVYLYISFSYLYYESYSSVFVL